LQNLIKHPKNQLELSGAVLGAEGKEHICEILDYAEFVLEKWRIKVLYLELKKVVGKNMDTISNMLTQIRNAQMVKKETIIVPFSALKYNIAEVLEKAKFVKKIGKRGRKEKKVIEITLKYESGLSVISGLKKISKGGQRVYNKYSDIKKVKGGYGIAIISTSKGLMTDQEARKQKIGGEVICQVW